MENFKHGIAPGINAPTEKGQGACNPLTLKTDNNKSHFRTEKASNQDIACSTIKSKLIAAYTRIKGFLAGFYLDRGIGIDSIAMVILMAVFAAVRGCHEL